VDPVCLDMCVRNGTEKRVMRNLRKEGGAGKKRKYEACLTTTKRGSSAPISENREE